MRIVVISLNDPNIYPALYHIAVSLAKRGAEVDFLSSNQPTEIYASLPNLRWVAIPKLKGILAKIPIIRGNYHGLFQIISAFRPDFIIAQHEYLIPAIAYKILYRNRQAKVVGYFSDYYKDAWHTRTVGLFSKYLDAYIDICDARLAWRQGDWPKMGAQTFVIRQAPFLKADVTSVSRHEGRLRLVFTSSMTIAGFNLKGLGRFIECLCDRGVSVDWYLPGPVASRRKARALTGNLLFEVHGPVNKSELIETLKLYDVGLHWAEMTNSQASNKIGEYISAGLVVAHSGNPGLSYLPDQVCTVFDPADPEKGADQICIELSSRAVVEEKRQASLQYHLDEMNFEVQAANFLNYMTENIETNISLDK